VGQPNQAGRTVGRYEIVKHLASGGMAEVLLARVKGIEGFERYVVIKQIQPERSRDASMVKMFVDEARLAASLHHASIVQVHDIGQEHGEYFIAMEYIHGESLHALLRKLATEQGRLPLDHLLTIVSAAASALHYAHEQKGPDRAPLGLVHRDVSPSNILVAYDGNVKVVDFGIAKAAHRSTETRSGMLKGKVSYMAPEQCMGMAVDRRSDVFALGIVLYELTTVRRLFKASTDFLTMSKIMSGSVPRPSLYRPELPPELEAIILKALALDPEQRYQTADEMRVALDQLAQRLGLRTSTTALGDYMIERFGRRPEPWLVDDHELSAVLNRLDFDGSGDGVAQVPDAIDDLPAAADVQPGSPLDDARRRATLRVGTGQHGGFAPPPAWAGEDARMTPSGTPMGWTPAPPPSPSRKNKKWWIGGAVIVVPAVVAMIVIAARTPEELNAATVEKAPSAAPAAVTPSAAPVAPVVREPTVDAAAEPAGRSPEPASRPVAPADRVPESDGRAQQPPEPAGPAAAAAASPETTDARPSPGSAKPARTTVPSADPARRGTTPAGTAATTARKQRGKPGKPGKPPGADPEAPPKQADDKDDKDDTWDPDALFLKAPQ
jgi:eukaryotic-like serine/threonine-protein kinase